MKIILYVFDNFHLQLRLIKKSKKKNNQQQQQIKKLII